jgi:hypothetical protein
VGRERKPRTAFIASLSHDEIGSRRGARKSADANVRRAIVDNARERARDAYRSEHLRSLEIELRAVTRGARPLFHGETRLKQPIVVCVARRASLAM